MLPWVFALLALALRVPALGKSIWLDEYFSIQAATQPNFLEALRYYDHPPLYFTFLRGWSALGGSEVFLRLPSLLFGAVAVGVLVKWMERDRLSSAVIGSMAVALPILCDQSVQVRHYSLLVLESALAFYFADRVSTGKGSRNAVGLALSLCAAVSTHLVGSMLVVSVIAFLVCRSVAAGRLDVRIVVSILPSVLLFCVIYFGFMIQVHGKTAATWWVPPLTVSDVWNAAFHLSGLAVFGSKWVVAPILVTIGVLVALLGDWRRSFPYLAAALVYWIQIASYSLLFVSIMLPRVLLPGMVPFMGFVAVQTGSVRPKVVRWLCCGGIALIAASMARGWWAHGAFQEPEPWRTIARIIRDEGQANARVLVVPEYSDGPLRFYLKDVPADQIISLPPNAAAPRVVETAAGRQGVFLVVRWDTVVNEGSWGYGETLAQIERTLGAPLWQRPFGHLSLSKYDNATVGPSR